MSRSSKSSKSRTARRSTAPADGKARLGVETLDARLVPSATANFAFGNLTINADNLGSTVHVSRGGIDGDPRLPGKAIYQSYDPNGVYVNEFANGQINTIGHFTGVSAVTFTGGAGSDRFVNNSEIPAWFDGGAGDDFLVGGTGTDTFLGSAGADQYTGGGGADILNRRGNHGFFTDGSADDVAFDSYNGAVRDRLSPAELKATGQLDVYKVGDKVWVTGPSGAGFAIQSARWSTSTAGGVVTFTATRDVTLQTAWGNVTLPASDAVPFAIKGQATGAPNVGKYTDMYLGGLPLSSQALNGAPGSFFSGIGSQATSALKDKAGMTLSMPTLRWGVGLGNTIGDAKAPLNPAVPYLYVSAANSFSVSYPAAKVEPPGSYSGTVAFSPGDGTVYADVQGLPVVGDFGIGVSPSGYLPFKPELIPDGLSDPNIYGHFFLRGQLDFTEIPVSLRGDVVIDLDSNDDGNLLGGALNPDRIKSALGATGGMVSPSGNALDPHTLLESAQTALKDVSIGLNAGVGLKEGGLSMEMARATVWRTPGRVAFRGSTTDLFAGTPLQGVISGASFDVGGWVNENGSWGFTATAATGKVAGVGAWVQVKADSASSTVTVHAELNNVLGLPSARLDGWANWTTGDFSLTGTVNVNINAEVTTLVGTANFSVVKNSSGVSVHANVNTRFGFDVGLVSYKGTISGDLTIDPQGNFHGDLDVTGSQTVTTPGWGVPGIFWVPGTSTTTEYKMPAPLHVDGKTSAFQFMNKSFLIHWV